MIVIGLMFFLVLCILLSISIPKDKHGTIVIIGTGLASIEVLLLLILGDDYINSVVRIVLLFTIILGVILSGIYLFRKEKK